MKQQVKPLEVSVERFERIVLDALYSRRICYELEINYCDIREDDVRRVREYIKDRYKIKIEDDKRNTNL